MEAKQPTALSWDCHRPETKIPPNSNGYWKDTRESSFSVITGSTLVICARENQQIIFQGKTLLYFRFTTCLLIFFAFELNNELNFIFCCKENWMQTFPEILIFYFWAFIYFRTCSLRKLTNKMTVIPKLRKHEETRKLPQLVDCNVIGNKNILLTIRLIDDKDFGLPELTQSLCIHNDCSSLDFKQNKVQPLRVFENLYFRAVEFSKVLFCFPNLWLPFQWKHNKSKIFQFCKFFCHFDREPKLAGLEDIVVWTAFFFVFKNTNDKPWCHKRLEKNRRNEQLLTITNMKVEGCWAQKVTSWLFFGNEMLKSRGWLAFLKKEAQPTQTKGRNTFLWSFTFCSKRDFK